MDCKSNTLFACLDVRCSLSLGRYFSQPQRWTSTAAWGLLLRPVRTPARRPVVAQDSGADPKGNVAQEGNRADGQREEGFREYGKEAQRRQVRETAANNRLPYDAK